MAGLAYAEHINQVNQIEHKSIVDASTLFERDLLEREAYELIGNRAHISKPEILAQEYSDNSRTALMEALTASGHLSRVTLSGKLEVIEAQLLGRLLNGWDDNLPNHEKDRRFSEICNVLYGQRVRAAIVAGKLPENTAVLEISDYPEELRGQRLGYRDKNKKGMVRSTHLVSRGNEQYELIIEQVSRSNATGSSTIAFLNSCNVWGTSECKPVDLTALETPLIYSTYDYVDGVVDIMRLLDRHTGPGVLYGDNGAEKSKHVSYDKLRQESDRREAEINCFVGDLAKLEAQLNNRVKQGQLTYRERTDIFNGEIERILEAICVLEPSYAADTFGEKVAPAFYEAAVMVAGGQIHQATKLLSSTAYLREEVTFCGGGGKTKTVEELKEEGLGVNSTSTLIKKGKENWEWKDGVCVVKTCRTRPHKTKVGPCSICKRCQVKFDRGDDPTKEILPRPPRRRGEQHNVKRKKTRQHIGNTALRPRLERKRGERLSINHKPTTRQRQPRHHDIINV